jgi:hypothetical protein
MADPVQSDARAARLAAALRANLARRKARDRDAPPPPDDKPAD